MRNTSIFSGKNSLLHTDLQVDFISTQEEEYDDQNSIPQKPLLQPSLIK